MKDYWLAKLISSVLAVVSRKRLQKAVYLLQLNHCPLQCDYILHYYGPYSFELATLVDQLESSGIIKETREPLPSGVFRYKTAVTEEKGKKALEEFEKQDKGKQVYKKIQPFISKFKELNEKDLWILELAATVAFFYEGNWDAAKKQTAKFKEIPITNSNLKEATKLAKKYEFDS